MIAIDTSAMVAFFGDDHPLAASLVEEAFDQSCAVFPPVVLSELLSDSKLPSEIAAALLRIPLLETSEGYWERAGRLRAVMLSKGRKARLADCLIAQSCLDHNLPLLTLDKDFRAFQKHCRLKLILK